MKKKVFNYSELHFSEGTSFKIHTLKLVVQNATPNRQYPLINYLTLEICSNQNIELPWVRDKLHATVINDHLIELDVRILFGNLGSSAQKQTIGQLHDVL